MERPKHILLVANSITDSEIAEIKSAMNSAPTYLSIKASIVYILPDLPSCYFSIPSMAFLAEKYYDEARDHLVALGRALNVGEDHQWLITGRIRTEVLRLADKLGVDFILANSTHLQDLHTSLFANSNKSEPLVRSIHQMRNLVPQIPLYPYSIY